METNHPNRAEDLEQDTPALSNIIERNIRAIIQLRLKASRDRSSQAGPPPVNSRTSKWKPGLRTFWPRLGGFNVLRFAAKFRSIIDEESKRL